MAQGEVSNLAERVTPMMSEGERLPLARFSQVVAMVCLGYATLPFLHLQLEPLTLALPGFLFVLPLTSSSLAAIGVTLLVVSGMDWILQEREERPPIRYRLVHWPLPALVAWAISVPLGTLQVSPQWWLIFGLGSVLLTVVMAAEYVVAGRVGAGQFWAYVTLTAVSFALFLILAITLRAAGVRLYLQWLVLVPAIVLIVLRNLYLRLIERWAWDWAVATGMLIIQISTGLHYLPLRPLSYGLILTGMAYGLTSLAGALEEGRPWRSAWVEPLVMMSLFGLLAFVFGR